MLSAKRGVLLTNERLKLYKKPSTWILMGIIVVLTLAGMVLSQLFLTVSQSIYNTDWQQQYNDMVASMTVEAKQNPSAYSSSDIESLKYLLENGIEPLDWRTDAIFEYYDLKYGDTSGSGGKSPYVPNYGGKGEVTPGTTVEDGQPVALTPETEAYMAKLMKLVKDDDWKKYIQLKIDQLKEGKVSYESADEKQVAIDMYAMYLEWNIVPVAQNQYYYYYGGNEETGWENKQLEVIRTNKLALLRGEDTNGSVLNSTQRAACQDKIDVALKRLSTKTPPVSGDSFLGLLESAVSSMDMISILLIVFAGGIFASEFSSGTIKLLLITPHKRRKIFWAKTILMLEVTLITFAAVFVLAFLFSGIFTGFDNIGAMQVVSLFGVVWYMPYLLYILLCSAMLLVPVITYGAMAMMLSAVTRKSSVSIAVTLIIMFGSEVFVSLLMMMSTRQVIPGVKFLLFVNTTLATYLPTAGTEMYSQYLKVVDGSMTLGFSLAVLVAYLICFLWIARDSFCRRDIK